MRERPAGLALLPVLAFVAAFAVVPVALLFAGALAGAGGWAGVDRVLADPLTQAAARNSVDQGGLSAAGALLLGYPAGCLLGRHRFRGRSTLVAVLLVPFLLPSLVVVLGIEALFGPGGVVSVPFPPLSALGGGLGGIVATNVVFNAPLVTLLTVVGVESAPRDLEETAQALGAGRWRAFLDVWGPPSWVGAAAGALLTFLFSALAFAAPLLLCGPSCYTLEARIWALDQVLVAPGAAALLALAMVGLFAAPTLAYLLLLGRLRARPRGTELPADPIAWRNPATLAALVPTAILLAGVAALLGAVVGRGLLPLTPGAPPGSAYAALFDPSVTVTLGVSTASATLNSLFFAAVATALALLLGVVAGFALLLRPGYRRPVAAFVFVPLLFSPIVLSFALSGFYRPLIGGSGTIGLLIVLSQAALAFPFALQALEVPLRRLPARFRESAQALGAPPGQAYLDVEVPLVRTGMVTAGLFAFALSLGEFTATYFLTTSGFTFTTLPVELYRLAELRHAALANAVGGLLVLVSLAAFVLVASGGRRVEL